MDVNVDEDLPLILPDPPEQERHDYVYERGNANRLFVIGRLLQHNFM